MLSFLRRSAKRYGLTLALVSAATLAASTANYVLSFAAARVLSIEDFGQWGAALGALAILGTVGLAAQAVVARSATAGSLDPLPRTSPGMTWGLGIVAALLSFTSFFPLLIWLEINPLGLAALLASVPLSVVTASMFGLLQGSRQFGRLSLAILMFGLFRLSAGLIFLLISKTFAGLSFGVLAGSAAALLFVLAATRRPDSGRKITWQAHRRELWLSFQALALMFALSNLDVLLARALLAPYDSGLYAIGSLIAKVAFFLPSPILLVLYPAMVRRGSRKPTYGAVIATLLLGSPLVLVLAVRPSVVLSLVGQQGLEVVEPSLWIFALSGSLLAVVQVTLYARLAVRDSRVAWLLLSSVTALVTLVLLQPSPSITSIVLTLSSVAGITAVIGLWMDRNYSEAGRLPLEVLE